jgi:hypothetical protein
MSFRGNQEINDYTDLAALLQHSVPAVVTIHIRIVASAIVPTIGVATIGVSTIGVAAIVSAIAAIVAAPASISTSIAIAE